MPDSFPEIVHQALRDWYKLRLDSQAWLTFVNVAQSMMAKGQRSQSEPRKAIKAWILRGLYCLQNEDSQAANLLRQRFLDDDSVRAVANRWNVSDSLVQQRQREAIVALARCLWREEVEAIAAREARILNRLEIAVPVRLFGVDDKQAELINLVGAEEKPWIIAVDGMGGIGKTTLVDTVVRQIAPHPLYLDIGWISARRNTFTLWGGLDKRTDRPALTVENLIDAILSQFGAEQAIRLPYERKLGEIRKLLKSASYLVVIDNLETAADYQALIPQLYKLRNPSRFLLTSRHSLRAFPTVYSLTIGELSLSDSLELMRHEARTRGLHELAGTSNDLLTQIYRVAGGNPLALKLIVGQLHTLSLSEVLKNLRLAQGQRIEDLYYHLYWHSWQTLSESARQVLITMPLVTEQGSEMAQIVAASELPEGAVSVALAELVNASLVNKVGGIQGSRFAIHQLTETFLIHEVFKWPSETRT